MIKYLIINTRFKILIFLASLFLGYSIAQFDESTIKAVYIERFTRFIDWPKESEIDNSSKPFVITLIGEDDFYNVLKDTYRNMLIKNKKVEIKYISEIKNISDTQILFISRSEKNNIEEIISNVNNSDILLIGDFKDFASKGVHINFYIEDERIRFEINENALKKSGFQISHLLLSSARVVELKK